MHFVFLLLASFSMMLGVAMGAFASHGLRGVLSEQSMAIYQTAVNFHMWHGLGLGIIAVFFYHVPQSRLLTWAGSLMFIGILLFSGSLYCFSVFDARGMAAITPIGGTAFILAWLLVCIFAFRQIRGS